MRPLFIPNPIKALQSKQYRMRLLALLLIVASLLGAGTYVIRQLTQVSAASGDWPMYLHDYARDGAGTDTTISPSNASQLMLNWTFKTGGPIASAPATAGGMVFVGSWDGYEYAINASSGVLVWRTFLGQTTSPCYPQLAGVSSGANITNGVLYVGGGDSNLYALDPNSGAVLWKVFLGDNTKGWYNWSSPLVYNGYLYVGTASVGDCPLIPGQLLQISLTTHLIVKAYNTVPIGQVGGGIWTSPSVDPSTNTIFITIGNLNPTAEILALDANTLTVKSSWSVPQSDAQAGGGDSDFSTSPTLFTDTNKDQLLGAINKNGLGYVFNRNNLAAGPLWKTPIAVGGPCPECGDGSVSSAAFGKGTLFMAGGNTLLNGKGYLGSVNALNPATGQHLWQHSASSMILPALAYSNGLVMDGAGSTLEVLDASNGTRLWSYTMGGQLYAEPTVANGQIFAGSTDNTIYAFGLDTPTTPPADANCPSNWTCQDIGKPTTAPAGSENVTGNSWNVNSSDPSVGGSEDQFRFESRNVSGDTQIVAQVTSQQVTNGSEQAGLMIRQSNNSVAPYYAIFAEPNHKVVVQYRVTFASKPITIIQTNTASLPLYLEIQRVGDHFQAGTSTDGVNYTLVAGDSATIPLPAATLVGLAVSSGAAGTANGVSYHSVIIQAVSGTPNPPASPSPCPSGWNCADVGNPTLVGDQSASSGVWTVKGAGGGIQYASDQFHYVWQQLAGDGSISTHIASQKNTSPLALAGVMLRQNTAENSAYYGAFVTPDNHVVVQYRKTTGLRSQTINGPTSTIPINLMVARSHGTYCTYSSSNRISWNYVVGSCVSLTLTGPMLAGLAVTSGSNEALGADTFDSVTLTPTAPAVPTICPTGWNCADIGYPAPVGSQSRSNGTWTILGGGTDIYDTYDQFHYVWQSLASDGSVSAHISSQNKNNSWAKAGVMLRQSSQPDSIYYAALATPGNGIVVQYRTAQGSAAQENAQLSSSTIPIYLMVARSANVFSAYTSKNGTTWTLVPGSSVTITLTGTVLAGLAVSSHDESTLDTVTLDSVVVSTALVCPARWTCSDIGSPPLTGTQSESNGSWTVQAGGADIFGTADQFHYMWQSLATNGSVSAQVLSQSNANSKAGVMLRLTNDRASPFYDAIVTPDNGVLVQYRKSQAASVQQSANLSTLKVPVYLMVARTGTTFSAYTSSNGTTWTLVSGSSVTLANMTGTLLAGFVATSHDTTKLSTVLFNTINVSTCPLNWSCADIGHPVPSGDQTENNGSWTMAAGGNDIWGTSDTFHYAWQQLAGNGVVDAQVTAQSNNSTTAKAGVMLRQSSDPASTYYAAFVTPSNGILVQYRTVQGGNTSQIVMKGTTPIYLLVQRSGTTYSTYTSSNGNTWTLLAGSNVTVNMTGSILAGLAATSHNSNILDTIVFNNVNVSTGGLPENCPTGWRCADIGSPDLSGGQSVTNGTWTMTAGGTDIYNPPDQFHYAWQQLAGNGSVSAQVVSQSNTSSWAKAGVMIRQDNSASSAYYFAMATPGNGIAVQYRTTAGGGAQTLITFNGNVPVYLAVARTGTTFTTYTSSDGVNWTVLDGSRITINMTGSVLAGLAATSHDPALLATITFSNVNVGTTIP